MKEKTERNQKIYELYMDRDQKWTYRSLAAQYHVDMAVIRRIIKRERERREFARKEV